MGPRGCSICASIETRDRQLCRTVISRSERWNVAFRTIAVVSKREASYRPCGVDATSTVHQRAILRGLPPRCRGAEHQQPNVLSFHWMIDAPRPENAPLARLPGLLTTDPMSQPNTPRSRPSRSIAYAAPRFAPAPVVGDPAVPRKFGSRPVAALV